LHYSCAGVQADTNASVPYTWALGTCTSRFTGPTGATTRRPLRKMPGTRFQQQNAGRLHPSPEVLNTIFGEADRVKRYQGEPGSTIRRPARLSQRRAAVELFRRAPWKMSRASPPPGQIGYHSGWTNGNRAAAQWTTRGGKPRLVLVNFNLPPRARAARQRPRPLEMELRIHQRQMQIFLGHQRARSRAVIFPPRPVFFRTHDSDSQPGRHCVDGGGEQSSSRAPARTCPSSPAPAARCATCPIPPMN